VVALVELVVVQAQVVEVVLVMALAQKKLG